MARLVLFPESDRVPGARKTMAQAELVLHSNDGVHRFALRTAMIMTPLYVSSQGKIGTRYGSSWRKGSADSIGAEEQEGMVSISKPTDVVGVGRYHIKSVSSPGSAGHGHETMRRRTLRGRGRTLEDTHL